MNENNRKLLGIPLWYENDDDKKTNWWHIIVSAVFCVLLGIPVLNLFAGIFRTGTDQGASIWLIPWKYWWICLIVGIIISSGSPFLLMPKYERKEWLKMYIIGGILFMILLIVVILWMQVGVSWNILPESLGL